MEALLAKESDKWGRAGRRRELYAQDRDRGAMKFMETNATAHSYKSIQEDCATSLDNDVISCTEAEAADKGPIISRWDGKGWTAQGIEFSSTTGLKKPKTGLKLLYMDVKVPSLDSLLM